MNALRALLTDIVDYAGLFPPAGLDLRTAASNYASYRRDDDAWMLGRFVVPVARLDELRAVWAALGDPAPAARVSAVAGPDPVADIERIHRFNDRHGERILIDCVEGKIGAAGAIRAAASSAGNALDLFVEIPAEPDPEALVAAIADGDAQAKIRTGGVTPDAFPGPGAVIRFMRRCVAAGVRFKATAGLHHPLSAEYRLTYETGAACGAMFGFLNVFLAAAFVSAGMSAADAERLLDERRADSFTSTDAGLGWEGNVLTVAEAVDVRRRVAASFGSCSFREPVDELRALGFLS